MVDFSEVMQRQTKDALRQALLDGLQCALSILEDPNVTSIEMARAILKTLIKSMETR